jgi:hypothetical protein
MLDSRKQERAFQARPRVRVISAVLASLALFMFGLASGAEAAIATYRLTTGSATFGLALPRGVVQSGVTVGSLPTQTDVKTRWPDGSIRFAVVSVQVPSTGDYEVSAGSAATGSFSPTWPSASVRFTIGGQIWTATLPAFTATDSWLSGPVAREARVMVSPVNGSTPHPLLQVIFDVRSYAAGGQRVDITVQNTKDIPAGDSVVYDVGVTVNGSTVWSKSGVTQYYLTRWRKMFSANNLVQSLVTPDFTPFHLSGALPRFLPTVENKFYDTSGPNFDILKFGALAPYMMTPGGRAEIGPYPFWVAQYVVHKQQSQLEALLRHGEYAGSWSMSITEADGKTPITLDNYPGYWLDGRAGRGHPGGAEAPRDQQGRIRGVAPDPAVPDNQHLPALTYVPYLVTGDHFYIDQLKLIAAWTMIFTYPGDSTQNGMDFARQMGQGILAQNGTRGYAWPLREVVDAAAYLPDADPSKAYFVSRVANNLNWLDNYARTRAGGPLESTFWERNSGLDDPPYYAISLWQLSYLAWVVDHAGQQGFGPVQAFRDRQIRTQIKFMTPGQQGYPPEYGAPYYPRIGRLVNGTYQHFTTMQEVFNYNHGDQSGWAANDPQPGHRLPQPINGYYGPEARILLAMGVRENIPGAAASLAWLQNWPGLMGDVNGRSGFALNFSAADGTNPGPAPSAVQNVRIVP